MKQTTIATPADDPKPATEWEIWYRDRFDRESPPRAEVGGSGLIPALVELWGRFLFETVQRGEQGFSEFSLDIDRRRIVINGDLRVAQRMKQWTFGDVTSTVRTMLDEADLDVLHAIARAHVRCLAHEPEAERAYQFVRANVLAPIFECAARAADRDAFLRELATVS